MSKIQIIFDFDGVILNSHKVKTSAFYYIFKEFGKRKALKAQKYHLKNVGISRIKKFKHLNKNLFKKENIKIKELNKKFTEYCINKISDLKIDIYLLNFFKKNYKKYDFYISTGTPQIEIIKILKEKKIFQFFKKVYGSPKSKIKHINLIKNKNQKRIFIGDSKEDYISAKKTNTKFILKEHAENYKEFEKIKIFKIKNFKNLNYKINYFYII